MESVLNVNVENGIIKKKEGFSAEELDDLIMKEGKYGKYYTEESIPQTRHDAYADQRFPVWSPASLIINPCHRNLTINNVINRGKGEFHGFTQLKNNIQKLLSSFSRFWCH